MITNTTAALAVGCAILGVTLIVVALLATSEAGIALFIGGIWALVAAIGFGVGWAFMRDVGERR